MKQETATVLQEIKELAHVTVENGEVGYVPPAYYANVYDPSHVLKYLKAYSSVHKDFNGEYYLCLYDGWREYSCFSPNPHFVAWNDCNKTEYLGVGSLMEPRFRHTRATHTYPELNLPVLAFNRHKGDRNTWLIPDVNFLWNQHAPYIEQVDAHDIAYADKLDKAVWRGSRNTHNACGAHPRDIAVSMSGGVLDASYARATLAEQLRYKVILDVDGMGGSWSAFHWKMASNSLVMSHTPRWEHWTHRYLVPGKHYMEFDWHNAHLAISSALADSDSADLAKAGAQVIRSLTYDFAVNQYHVS